MPEIYIWRVANLMLKRYGDEADIESAIRAEELADAGDWAGEPVWRRIIDAIGQLESTTPPGHCTDRDDDAMLTSPVHGVASGVEEPDRVVVRGNAGRRSKALRREKENPNEV